MRTFGILLVVVVLGLLIEAILTMPLVDGEGDIIKEGVVPLVYGVHGQDVKKLLLLLLIYHGTRIHLTLVDQPTLLHA